LRTKAAEFSLILASKNSVLILKKERTLIFNVIRNYIDTFHTCTPVDILGLLITIVVVVVVVVVLVVVAAAVVLVCVSTANSIYIYADICSASCLSVKSIK
jgi:hypothetical protein